MRNSGKRVALALALMAAVAGFAAAQTTTTYTYDALGRVVTSTNSASNLQSTYKYDPADNRTNLTVAASPPPNPPNGVSCTAGSASVARYTTGPIVTPFNPTSNCTDSTSGATMSLYSFSVTGAGSGVLSAPGTISLTLSVGTTTISYTVVDNQGGSSSSTFVFNRSS